MANLMDMISLILTLAIFGGIAYVVLLAMRSVSQGVESAKEGLKTQGIHITDKGVSVKTSKRFDREDYVDATQRGIMKTMNAASFRKGGAAHDPGEGGHSTPALHSSPSSSSSLGSDGKKRSFFKKSAKVLAE